MPLTGGWSVSCLNRPEREAVESLTRSLSATYPDRLDSILLYGLGERPAAPDREIQVLVLMTAEDADVEAQITDLVLDLLLDTGVYLSVRCLTRRQYNTFEQMRVPFAVLVQNDRIPLWSAA